jgi:hypothetical protein
MKIYILAISVALWFSSCCTKRISERQTVFEHVTDSVYVTTRMVPDTIVFPTEKVSLFIPYTIDREKLRKGIRREDGRASVSISAGEKGFTVTAECDSLLKVIEKKEIEITHLREKIKEKTTVEKELPSRYGSPGWCISTVVLIIILVYFIRIRIREYLLKRIKM